MKAALPVLLLMFAAFTLAAAGKHPPVVSVSMPETVEIAAGQTTQAHVAVTVVEGFHVQANPASRPYLIPTRLELTPADPVTREAPCTRRENHIA